MHLFHTNLFEMIVVKWLNAKVNVTVSQQNIKNQGIKILKAFSFYWGSSQNYLILIPVILF